MIKIYTYGDKSINYSKFVFSGGEIQIRIDENELNYIQQISSISIHADLHSSDDIMELLLITNALREIKPSIRIHLYCPYLPYARQDRVCHPGEAFSLNVIAQILNSQFYASIVVDDVHSDIAKNLIYNLVNCSAGDFFSVLIDEYSCDDLVIAPDKGAITRAQECADMLMISKVVHAQKVRDPDTGKILRTEVPDLKEKTTSNFIIVDDICDGGRTFIELAKVLRPFTSGKIVLYVTHGIFSAGFDVLKEHIDEIYVANLVNVCDPLPDFVHKI